MFVGKEGIWREDFAEAGVLMGQVKEGCVLRVAGPELVAMLPQAFVTAMQ